MKHLSLFSILIMLLASCGRDEKTIGQVTIVSVRDMDTLHVKILNKTRGTIYVPPNYLGTYNIRQDTIFLEVVDKPQYASSIIYNYTKVFPFELNLSKQIPFEEPDTTIKTVRQVYYFNQFLVEPFVAISPDSSYYKSLTFYVPGRAKTVQAVYYTTPFLSNNKGGDIANYTIDDWVKFDSLNSKYAITEVLDRVYLK